MDGGWRNRRLIIMGTFGNFDQAGSDWLCDSMQAINSAKGVLYIGADQEPIPNVDITILAVDSRGVGSLSDQAEVSSELRQFVIERSAISGHGLIQQGDRVVVTLGGHEIEYRIVKGLDGNIVCDFDKYKRKISFTVAQDSARDTTREEDWL